MFFFSLRLLRDFFLDKQREKARLEAEMKMVVTLRQFISAGEAKPVAPLGVMLSQYYLALADFCKDFNEKTSAFTIGVPLTVKVIKTLRGKDYRLNIRSPTTSFLLYCGQVGDTKKFNAIDFLTLFDIVRLKNNFLNLAIKSTAHIVFSVLRNTCNRIYIDTTPFSNLQDIKQVIQNLNLGLKDKTLDNLEKDYLLLNFYNDFNFFFLPYINNFFPLLSKILDTKLIKLRRMRRKKRRLRFIARRVS